MNSKIFVGEDLKPFVHNTLFTTVNEDGSLTAHRFTDNQLDFYRKETEKYGISSYDENARSSAGVILDLETDSEFLGLRYACRSVTSPGFALQNFDLYVDGCLYDHRFITNISGTVFCMELPEGMHRVTLFFPWTVETKLRQLLLSRNAEARPVQRNKRVLAFGDSITQGHVCDHPSLSYVSCIARKTGAEVLNQGVGGYVFERGSLDPELAAWKPDVITVAYGVNDYVRRQTLEEFRTCAAGYLRRLNEVFPHMKILGIMPIYRGGDSARMVEKMREYTRSESFEALREEYGKYPNITVLEDTYMPRCPEFFRPDYLHPIDLGHVFYGESVSKAVNKLLNMEG